MQVFVTVVDCGSQSSAADKLDLSRPVVSRYLAELEEWAGVRLMHRTTRKLSLTPAGAELLPRCRQVLDMADDMQASVAALPDAPSGLLRITVSTSFGQSQLATAVAEYVRRYPQVAVDMVLLDRAVNLVDERIDLALRITNELDPNLIARELMWCRSVICASPDYLREHGPPQRIEELGARNCLTHFYYGKSVWHFDHNGEPVSVPVSGNISTNESAALMQMTLAGAGIAMLPLYLVAPALRSGELIEVLPEYRAQGARLYAVYASRKHMPASLRTMLEFLAERFRSVSEWDSHDLPREQRREHPPDPGRRAPTA